MLTSTFWVEWYIWFINKLFYITKCITNLYVYKTNCYFLKIIFDSVSKTYKNCILLENNFNKVKIK